MKEKNDLKTKRKDLNLSTTAVSLQTGLQEKLIREVENNLKPVDQAAFFILRDHYQEQLGESTNYYFLSYMDWLDALKVKDDVLLKERIVGTGRNLKYRLDAVKEITDYKIILATGIEIKRKNGELTYETATANIMTYKIYPKSNAIETYKELSFLEQAVMLYSSYGLF